MTDALFDVDPADVHPMTVWPLMNVWEETTGWFVEGTADEAVARRQVQLWLDDEYDPVETAELLVALVDAKVAVRIDWRWESGEDDDTQELEYGAKKGADLMIGVRFEVTR